MHAAGGQPPQKKAVDCAEREFAVFHPSSRAGHTLQQPGDFAGREIWIEQQTCAACDLLFATVAAQFLAERGRAPVLPHDCVMDGSAARALPDWAGLALGGNSDTR